MVYFIYFFIYSFIGFVLETLYTFFTRGLLIWKKCFLINWLCPVYGFGAIAILLSTRLIKNYKILTMLVGAVAATAVEFVVHLFYEKILGVTIWNYSDLPLNIDGRICLTFTFFWCILSGFLVYFVHPFIEKITTSIPKTLYLFLIMFVGIDAILSTVLYKKIGSRNAVNISWIISHRHSMLG